MTTYAVSKIKARATTFARDAVYSEFRGRDARALYQADFVDRTPNQALRLHIEVTACRQAVLERFAEALLQVGDDAGPSAV